ALPLSSALATMQERGAPPFSAFAVVITLVSITHRSGRFLNALPRAASALLAPACARRARPFRRRRILRASSGCCRTRRPRAPRGAPRRRERERSEERRVGKE